MKGNKITTLFGIEIYYVRNAIFGSIGLWVILAILCYWIASFSVLNTVLFSTFAVLLHWSGEILHQYGHAIAAKQTGSPMQAIRLWFLLSTSIYPKNEPDLPADTHLYRAIGGPIFSLGMSFVGLLLTFLLQPLGDMAIYLALFFAADNFFIFTIGALIPLGFTDGSTILKYWRLRD